MNALFSFTAEDVWVTSLNRDLEQFDLGTLDRHQSVTADTMLYTISTQVRHLTDLVNMVNRHYDVTEFTVRLL